MAPSEDLSMPLYDYVCENGHRTERRADYHLEYIDCPECEAAARRVATYRSQYIIGETVRKVSGRLGPDPFDMALQRAATENKVPR